MIISINHVRYQTNKIVIKNICHPCESIVHSIVWCICSIYNMVLKHWFYTTIVKRPMLLLRQSLVVIVADCSPCGNYKQASLLHNCSPSGEVIPTVMFSRQFHHVVPMMTIYFQIVWDWIGTFRWRCLYAGGGASHKPATPTQEEPGWKTAATFWLW